MFSLLTAGARGGPLLPWAPSCVAAGLPLPCRPSDHTTGFPRPPLTDQIRKLPSTQVMNQYLRTHGFLERYRNLVGSASLEGPVASRGS